MNPATAAALLSRTPPAKKPEQPPKPAVRPDLVAAAGGPEALQELVRQEKLRRQKAATAPPEAPPARIPEPPTLEQLRASMPPEVLGSALAAMARAQVRLPRPPKEKPKPVTFTPKDPATVAMQIEAAVAALDGIDVQVPKRTICRQRRYANQLAHALGAARRELERAKALAEGKPA
jgi:hypothetical protein